MYPTQDGFIEIDPRTGAVTQCKRNSEGYNCTQVTAGDVLLKEEPGGPAEVPSPPPRPPSTARAGPSGPRDEEIDRALDVMERFLRRFMDILREQKLERT